MVSWAAMMNVVVAVLVNLIGSDGRKHYCCSEHCWEGRWSVSLQLSWNGSPMLRTKELILVTVGVVVHRSCEMQDL